MSGKPELSSELSRDLSLFHITMMGLGMMIGAGVFLGIGSAIAVAGPGGVMLTFALNGVLAMFTAMSYAELSSAIPRAGGAYNFARLGFGRGTSFVAGWMEWFASSVAGSLYAVTFAIYLVRFAVIVLDLELAGNALMVVEKVVALLVASFFIYINYRGASETGRVGAFFTLGQTLFLLFIGVVGFIVVLRDPSRLHNFQPFMPEGWGKLLVTMGFTYVAFEGYEVIAQAGDETVDARRNLPKAMIYSVVIVTFTYVAVAFASVVAVKTGVGGVAMPAWEWIGQFGSRGFGEAVSRLMPAGNFFLTLAVIFAATSALNATIYSATRASYALGRDNMLPPVFATISSRTQTPWVALLGTGAIVVIVATVLPTKDVASSASIMFLFLFFLVNVCVIKIRRNMGDELTYGFLMPFFPVFPVLAIGCQAVLAVWLIHMSLIAWIVAPVWILCGLLVYRFYSKSRVKATEHEILVLEEEAAPAGGDEYRIMVALANPDTALSLVRNTYAICVAKNASVELLHMVPVPDQVPLSDADRYMGAGKEAIGETMLYLSPQFPSSSTIRYCRNVARGIVSAVREKGTDLLIMGWQGQTISRGFTLGSTLDPVVERVPCNVVIFKDCGDRKFRRALVPVAGGPNAVYALETASILVDRNDGNLVLLSVRHPNAAAGFDVEGMVAANAERLLPRDRIEIKSIVHDNVVTAILEEAENEDEGYDLVAMGCSLEPFIRQVGRDSVPLAVARLCTKSMVMAKSSAGIRSWISRWI